MKDSIENEVLKMIKIISDSTCDLSQEVLERYDIDIIPLHIVKGDVRTGGWTADRHSRIV